MSLTGSDAEDERSSHLIPPSIILNAKINAANETAIDKPAEAHLLYRSKGRKANLEQSFPESVVEEEFQIHISEQQAYCLHQSWIKEHS